MRNSLLALSFFFLSLHLNGQIFKDYGFGGSASYNFPIKGSGLGVRSHLHFNDSWFISPQFNLYPGWNQIIEFYAGANINYNLTPTNKWGLYLSAGPYYNHWFNFISSSYSGAKLYNFSAELGGGIVKNKGCWRPFIEYRANSKWWESNLRLGLLVYFGSCGKNKRNSQLCPAFTQL